MFKTLPCRVYASPNWAWFSPRLLSSARLQHLTVPRGLQGMSHIHTSISKGCYFTTVPRNRSLGDRLSNLSVVPWRIPSRCPFCKRQAANSVVQCDYASRSRKLVTQYVREDSLQKGEKQFERGEQVDQSEVNEAYRFRGW